MNLKTTLNTTKAAATKEMAAPLKPAMERAFELCVHKTRSNIRRLADTPQSYAYAVDGDYFSFPEGFFDIGNWTSSFFSGMALLAWDQTEDEFFLQQVQRLAPWYYRKVHERHLDTMHDLGFLYSLYSVALRKLTGAKGHAEVALRAADVLADRFVPEGNYIRAWGRVKDPDSSTAGLAIIDCLMNLPLLFWASRESDNQRHHEIAVRHADTALQHFIRPDYSVCHAYRFDLKTGKPAGPATYGVWKTDAQWARGAAWAIYGFALCYTYTKHAKYLDASLRLARKFVSSLDDELVPIWDFTQPAGSNAIRDASAASIAVCGFQELVKHRPAETWLCSAAAALLNRLCSHDYLDFNENCPGILKFAQIGDDECGAKNAYTSWGDYFLMEALARELFKFEPWW
jgi:unsaturated chondroitin disaccharide hydrolase